MPRLIVYGRIWFDDPPLDYLWAADWGRSW